MGKFKNPQPTTGVRIQPRTSYTKSDLDEHPVFSLRYLGGDYCLSKCQREEKAAFASTLHQLGQRTWGEINGLDRHKNGSEIIPRESIKGKIPNHITPDVRFIAFRFYKKAPMVGYREGNIFHIIWLDRQFILYDHG